MIETRLEQPGDEAAIHLVNEQAFEGPGEANLVDALRKRGGFALSMVAIENDQVVGHILFSPVTIARANRPLQAVGLGPMAVLPTHQQKGIGSQLLRSALDKCRQLGYDAVVVVGHPEFYSRFGFVPAKQHNLRCGFDAPDEAFMALELQESALQGMEGLVRYPREFREV
jgi:putative acetyltransferase